MTNKIRRLTQLVSDETNPEKKTKLQAELDAAIKRHDHVKADATDIGETPQVESNGEEENNEF